MGRSFYNPIVQGAIVAGVMGLIVLIASFSGLPSESLLLWNISVIALMMFSFGNALLGLFQADWRPYLIRSIPVFIVLNFWVVLIANQVSPVKLINTMEIRMLIIVNVIFYMMIMILATVFRMVVRVMSRK